MKEFYEIKKYVCKECGITYNTKKGVQECKCPFLTCSKCGARLKTTDNSICKNCEEEILKERDNIDFELAIKYDIKQYDKTSTIGYLYNDEYYIDSKELIKAIKEDCKENNIELPKYIWGTNMWESGINSGMVIDYILEDSHEDADVDIKGIEELEEFAKTWNDKYAIKNYEEDRTIAILLSEEDYNEEN